MTGGGSGALPALPGARVLLNRHGLRPKKSWGQNFLTDPRALVEASVEDGFALTIPPPKYCTDNAAMIAAAGTAWLERGYRAALDLGVDPGLPLS